MGENKTFLPFGSYASLIEYQYQRLLPFFNPIFISTKQSNFDFLPKECAPVILDENPLYSPLIALKSILTHIDAPQVFILPVDTPFVQTKQIQTLMQKGLTFEITIAQTSDKTHNLCGVFSTSLLPKIQAMLDADIHKIGYLIKQSHSCVVTFSQNETFLNVNTPEEYKTALSLL